MDGSGAGRLRWRLAEDDGGQGALFPEEELVERHVGRGEFAGTEFLHVKARRVLNEVPSGSRLPFRHTVNPYRGCGHACPYCFARPSHAYLGLGTAEDFERRIVVKVNAPERLRAELADRRWRGEPVALGTNTDPYQRAEGKYRLTQGILGVLAAAPNPFSVLTKSTLVLRDLDLLAEASRRTDVRVNLSVGTLDEQVWQTSEPGTPHPRLRLEAVARLNAAGVACGVLVAPVLPGLSDRPEQVEAVVRSAVAAGAVSVGAGYLHLRPGVKEHYLGWLAGAHPALVAEHERRYYRRAYLPEAEQRELAERVRRLVAEARGEVGAAGADRGGRRRAVGEGPERGERRPSSPPLPPAQADQLAFWP